MRATVEFIQQLDKAVVDANRGGMYSNIPDDFTSYLAAPLYKEDGIVNERYLKWVEFQKEQVDLIQDCLAKNEPEYALKQAHILVGDYLIAEKNSRNPVLTEFFEKVYKKQEDYLNKYIYNNVDAMTGDT